MDFTSLDLGFREATPTDHPDILTIHNLNVRDRHGSSTNGFLLAPVTEADIQEKCDRQTQYFVAHLVDSVIGFVTLSRPTLTEEMLSHVQWNESALLTKVLHAQPIYIQTVATHPEFSGRGVAQFMYRSLYERFPNDAFSAFIAMQPITNDRSLRFHYHQGFYAVGRICQDQLLDLQNYEAVLVFRDKA